MECESGTGCGEQHAACSVTLTNVPGDSDWGAHGRAPSGGGQTGNLYSGTFVCFNCRRRMNVRERAAGAPHFCRSCNNWIAADAET